MRLGASTLRTKSGTSQRQKHTATYKSDVIVGPSSKCKGRPHSSIRFVGRLAMQLGDRLQSPSEGFSLSSRWQLRTAQHQLRLWIRTHRRYYLAYSAEKFSLSIILPEGASDYKIWLNEEEIPFEETKSFWFLDYSGKPTLKVDRGITSKAQHRGIKVTYRFNRRSILKKPFIVFAAFFAFFLVLILSKRVHLKTLDSDHQHVNWSRVMCMPRDSL